MIPLLTDPAPGPILQSPPQTGATLRDGGAGVGLDFAGLLTAALPAEVSLPAMIAKPAGVTADAAALPTPDAAMPDLTPPVLLPPARLPTGIILPESGADLPGENALTPEQSEEPGEPEAEAIVALSLNQPSAQSPMPAPVPPQVPPQVLVAPVPVALAAASRPNARQFLHPSAPPTHATNAPMPEQVALPEAEGDAALPASPKAIFSDALAEAAPAATPAAQANALAPATAPASAAIQASAQPITAPPTADRAEPRVAPQQESAIAQVGELREALRAVRPEMTLRHAEFGFVSLRVEATGAQDWRAVLASRDPGFVPAIQAALAERAVSAAAETSAGNMGNNPGQGGSSDQRYGFSQGAGQGSSQPYMEQSPKRDEGASSHQRQQRSNADEAERAGAPDADHSAPRERGMFA